ncbi:MAG: LysR family transcriptional regulator [Burkholderia sp.]|jgi:DNA-binding transcriptional LysR family regulator|uniref:LysR family transcriptional regulator n=1 Tax=Burkholderia sp. TaxID=36773 RepID=UPI00282735DB|nr:LysR family transcriptional regulator [Burkholderia sp.]MDR0244235.1 LysR family transcriptional regulator [Burkholderia sp.]
MNVKLRRIEVFMSVVQNGGFSAAANALHIAQSAVSIAMKELERELGTILFVRTKRGVELTETGRLLRDRATPAMSLLQGIQQEIQDLESLSVGHVRIAAPAMVTQFALARVLPDFMREHPGIRVRVHQAGALEIEALVRSQGLDFGLTAHRGAQPGVESELLWSIPNVACIAPALARTLKFSRRISWKQLLDAPLAVYPPGFHQRDLMERHARELGVPLKIVLEAENPELIFATVRAGLAATTLPLAAVRSDPEISSLHLPQEEGDQLKVGICWPSERSLSKAAAILLDYLKSHVVDSSRRSAQR